MQNTKAYIMLVCATLFWAGNFMVGKYAFLVEIPPLTLVFYRWLLVWIILLPFTFKEIIKYKDTCLLYTSPSPRDMRRSRMPSSA